MSIKVKPAELKLATKLASQVRDVTASSAKRYPWLKLYRVVASDGGMTLYSNDGMTWLIWHLPLEEPTTDVYDIALSSDRFNEIALKSEEGVSYEITREDGQYVLTQGDRVLCLWEEAPLKYKQAGENEESAFEDQIFSVDSGVLGKNLKFAVPFLDVNNAQIPLSLCTWTTTGMLVGGWNRQQVRIEGMPCPPVDMSFKQKVMKSVVAFLNELDGDVYITISGGKYIFECPIRHHQLVISGESVHHPASIQELEGESLGVVKFDGKKLLSGVSLLNVTLPAEADRLAVTIEGERENAAMRVTVLGEESEKRKKSKDKFPIIREGDDGSDFHFVVNCRVFESCLGEMHGVILEGRCYFQTRRPRFSIEDERSTETDTYRCVFIPVTMARTAEEAEEGEVEAAEKEARKPAKGPILAKK